MIADHVRAALAKLTVGKGGVPGYQDILRDWTIRMGEAHPGYNLELRFRGRSHVVALIPDQVYSKTKTSMWARDKVWRLTPEAVEAFTEQIAKVIAKHDPDLVL